jgi:hypothetical protein
MLHPRSRSSDTLLEDVEELLGRAQTNAENLVVAHECMPEKVDERQRQVGRVTGNAALRLATYGAIARGEFDADDLGQVGGGRLNDVDMQSRVRSIALATLYEARSAHRLMGAHPSLAQLADPYSHLSVYWYRNAPGSAQHAIRESIGA